LLWFGPIANLEVYVVEILAFFLMDAYQGMERVASVLIPEAYSLTSARYCKNIGIVRSGK
jgi:hypothetical protein